MTTRGALTALDPIRPISLHARHLRDKPALLDGDASTSYGELWSQVERMSRWLREAGVGPGQRVAVAMEPSSAYAAVVLAVIAAGAAIAPINTRLTQREVDEYLTVLEPAMILLSETVSIAGDTPRGAAMQVPDTKGVNADNWIERLVRRRAQLCQGTDSPLDTALVIGTGGTTGLPKAASFSGSALALWCTHAALAQRLRSDDVELFASPFFHGTLVTSLLAVLTAGATVVITAHGNLGHTDVLHRGPKVTRIGGAPQLIKRLADGVLSDDVLRESIRHVQFGTTAASDDFLADVARWFPNAQLITGYGATEFGPVTRLYGPDCANVQCGVGHPIPHVDMAIMMEGGPTAEPGHQGELLVCAPWQMHSYWNNQRANEAAFSGHYLRSGDVAEFDEEGRVHLRGRIKDIIISGGENIYPIEVEAVLSLHPAVEQVAVYGIDDADWGEKVVATVVVRPGQSTTAEGLIAFARTTLAGYKVPKLVRFADEIPLTSNLKVDREALRGSAMRNTSGAGA